MISNCSLEQNPISISMDEVSHPKPDLTFFRAMLVLASMSPVFLVWGILGMDKIPDRYFSSGCALMILVPHLFLIKRIRTAQKNRNYKLVTVDQGKDSKEQLLTYFLPLILPLMGASFDTWRGFSATLVLFIIMAFASWHLGVFYINIFFAIFGYRIFSIIEEGNHSTEIIVIAKREIMAPGDQLKVVRLAGRIFYAPNTIREHAPL
jgi:hypothetical protein